MSTTKILKMYFKEAVIYFLIFALLFYTTNAVAAPSGPDVQHGDVSVNYNGNQTIVDIASDNAIINWQSLDTAQNEILQFLQNSSNAAVLNRITSGNPTQFDGSLLANGRVFVVNPAGVIFGGGAAINVAQLVASSLNISNQDFLNGRYEFSGGFGSVINYGDISAENVALIGKKVLNAGTITSPGGYVMLLSGDRVLLGQKGSEIVVELDSAVIPDGVETDIGKVTNQGTIDAENGTIVLAAGDIFSRALDLDNRAVKVDGGSGTVEQLGTISADGVNGDAGAISLTAGTEVVLGTGSLTTANAGTNGNGGDVIAYSPGMTDFQTGALIEAVGGSTSGDGGFVEISGKSFIIDGTVDASAQNGKAGKVLIDPPYITLRPGSGTTTPEVVYENWIESTSQGGTDVDLLAFFGISMYKIDGVQTSFASSAHGDLGLEGGSGDLSFRTKYDNGFIALNPADLISTDSGGNIYMLAGSGGIVVGDIKSYIADSSDKDTNPGQIAILAVNGGDVTTGSMQVLGGSRVEISAIAAGTLTVLGDVVVKTNTSDKTTKSIGKALICLIANEDVIVKDENPVISVEAHGQNFTTADICISAGYNVEIGGDAPDLGITASKDAKISALAKTSQADPANTADSKVVIHAGWNQDTPGTITIDDTLYNTLPGGDNSAFDITATAMVSKAGTKAEVDTSDTWVEDPRPEDEKDGSSKVWYDETGKTEDGVGTATIEMDNDEELPPDHPDSPCVDCPVPPFLPPEPAPPSVFDDSDTIGRTDTVNLDVMANDKDGDGNPLVGGTIADYTYTGSGTLVLKSDGTFDYTPSDTAVFVWDGSSAYAVFTDTFTYSAEDSEGRLSVNTATVTIYVHNLIPLLGSDSDSIHMSTAGTPTSSPFDLQGLITDDDGSGASLTIDLVSGSTGNGSVSLTDSTATYQPDNGYVSNGGSDSFQYKVVDNYIVDGDENPVVFTQTINITVTNALPTADGTTVGGHMGADVSGSVSFSDTPDGQAGGAVDTLIVNVIQPANGSVTFNTETGEFVYTPSDPTSIAGDSFTYSVTDGQQGSEPVVATIFINQSNAPPTAGGTTVNGHMGAPVPGSVTFSDTPDDQAGGAVDTLIVNVIQPANGSVTFNTETGAFVYTPSDPTSIAGDSFTYSVTDGQQGSEPVVATVFINQSNAPPTAGGTTVSGHMGAPVPGSVTFSDTPDDQAGGAVDPLTVQVESQPANGTLTFDPLTGAFTYTPTNSSYTGTDQFTYSVSDQQQGSVPVLALVIINLGNLPPVANNDAVSTSTNTPVSGNVLSNDFDQDFPAFLDPLRIVQVSDPVNGTVTYDPVTGAFTYTPDTGFAGEDSFIYYITDGEIIGGEIPADPVSAVVTITVTAPPVTPLLPPAPLPVVLPPEVEGCPAVLEAAAAELGITKETIQVSITNALATATNIQPCGACESLINYARILEDEGGSRMQALAQVFNEIAPSGIPFTPELAANIATTFNTRINEIDAPQYATALEYIDAFVGYIAVLEKDLGSPVGDSTAFAMEKHGANIFENDNPNIAAFVQARLAEEIGG
ncbi:MAG: Ig-like domain-containing protein [Planctomycetota bacterium]